MNNTGKIKMTDGLLRDNTVLSAGMIISPVIICTDTLKNSMALIYAFTIITFLTVLAVHFIPKKLPYAIKVILSAMIGSLIYIPIKHMTLEIYPEAIEGTGIYFPLIAVNSLIVYQSHNRFSKMKFKELVGNLIFYILGFDAVMLLSGFIRELFAYGTINNQVVNMEILISGVSEPFCGFIILGVLCGIYRKIRVLLQKNKG